MYECKNASQKDSITSDLKTKGYIEYVCDVKGNILKLHNDNTFCFTTSLKGLNALSLNELYSKVLVYTDAVLIETADKCAEIDITTDKFSGEVNYNSPAINNISFIKNIKKGLVTQYVSIDILDTYLAGYSNIGLTILFKSGKKLIRSKEKVDVNTSSGANWRYSVFFRPTAEEINLLKKEEITAVKLYIFDAEISQGDKIRDYANCVLITPKVTTKKK
jgi:hypothetical protein